MARLRLRSISILVAAAILLLPIFAFADSPAGTPADKVTKTTKTAMPELPAGAIITGITTTDALIAGLVVIIGGGLVGLGIVLAEEGGEDLGTNPGGGAAHHHSP